MSALSRSPEGLEGWPRPRLSKLLGAVLGGEVLAAVTLWILTIVLALAGVAPFGGAQKWVWLPWRIDGAWALVGAIGWGYVVCAIVAGLVRDGIVRRGYDPPSSTWLRISIAISGYGAMAIGQTAAARCFIAVLAGAVVIRLVAFHPDGSARAWRWSMTRRERVVVMVFAVLVGLTYSALHPFAADGSGGSYSSATVIMHGSTSEQIDVGLSQTLLPGTLTGVSFSGSGAAHFKLESVSFPRHLRAGHTSWIEANLKTTSCGDLSVNEVTVHYTLLGINTSETLPLQQPLTMICH